MPERTVDHALIYYRDSEGIERIARRGETVDLEGKEVARLDKLGALVPEGDEVDLPVTVPQPAPPVAPADAGRLNEKPKADAEEKSPRRPATPKA